MAAKGNVIEIGTGNETVLFASRGEISDKLVAYFALTKPRVTLMVTLISAAGFYLGSPATQPLNSLFVVSYLCCCLVAWVRNRISRPVHGAGHRQPDEAHPSGGHQRGDSDPCKLFCLA